MSFVRFVVSLAFLSTASTGGPAPLRVAAASDLQTVLPALAATFERDTGHHIDISFGSSGNFFAQLRNGAPFDIFFSADVEYPKQLA